MFYETYKCFIFLSTLSLRRATCILHHLQRQLFISIHALLAESDLSRASRLAPVISISIHALLAESDDQTILKVYGYGISIHALLAESDGVMAATITPTYEFLSTLSLRRATFGTLKQLASI